jgi:hypothetical protein
VNHDLTSKGIPFDSARSENALAVTHAGNHCRMTEISGGIFLLISSRGEQMAEIVPFIPKRELDRARLIEQAREIYESIFPTQKEPAGMGRDSEQ